VQDWGGVTRKYDFLDLKEVVFGSFGTAWTSNASFVCSYLHTFTTKVHAIKKTVSITNHNQQHEEE
jgi:hypothetical protein